MKLIVGMHRSGTSMVARILHEAGADFGDPESFYGPDRWNPDGYFEQVEIHSINMPLINGPWGRLAYLSLPSDATIRRRAARRSGRIRAVDARYWRKVVKENRFCLTLPAWHEQGARFERLLVVARDPLEVAISLRRRNRTPLRLGYRLWLEHNRRLLAAIERLDLPTGFIAYHHLLQPQRSLGRVAATLAVFGEGRDQAVLAEITGRVVSRAKNHSLASSRPRYPQAVEAMWQRLLEHCRTDAESPRKASLARGPRR